MAADAPRVVLDTQIIVRGLIRRRTSAAVELFDLALQGRRMIGVTSRILLDECARVLKMPEVRTMVSPPLDDDLISRTIGYVAGRFTVVPGAFQHVDRVPKDAKDNPLVEAALEGLAQAIVSDDDHVLSLKVIKIDGFEPVQVYAPGPFLKYVLK